MNEQEFPTGSVPVAVAARVYGKDSSWVRAGIISGWLPIGKATRKGKLVTTIEEMDSRYGRINYHISPKLLYEQTGYLWKGEKTIMGTSIRPEISKKKKYWIEKNRYFELKYFCLQYPIWKKAYISLDGLSRSELDLAFSKSSTVSDPTAKCAEARAHYLDRMNMVEQAAIQTDLGLSQYILKAVTEGLSYNIMKAQFNIPCSKGTYYNLYRRFFWLLNKERD